MPHLIGQLTAEGRGRVFCLAKNAVERKYCHQQNKSAFLEQWVAQQTTKGSLGVNQHKQQREEQHGIAQIGERYAPWVAVYGEHAATAVHVVRILV